ncbi:MAG TPA: ABC transporter C-terminal domain-containing protein, partial [Actinomycetota bacterium]|nr:ABC transporter C-terminal domain-containing protein [Actinomycetota bacterium]
LRLRRRARGEISGEVVSGRRRIVDRSAPRPCRGPAVVPEIRQIVDPRELTRRIAGLEARIEELERERAADVERLHTAQAALANTQVELLRASARTKGAGAPTEAPDEPAARAIPSRPDVARDVTSTSGSVDDALRRRISRFQEDLHAYRESFIVPPTETGAPPEPDLDLRAPADRRVERDRTEPRSRDDSGGTASSRVTAMEEPSSDDDRLSLRRRLASAANARHHFAPPEGVNERRDASGASNANAIPPPP